MVAVKYDRRLQFLRKALRDDGFSSDTGDFENYGAPLWGHLKDISDGEKYQAAQVKSSVTSRCVVPWSDLTASLTPRDAFVSDGETYQIVGMKEIGRRSRREFTAVRILT